MAVHTPAHKHEGDVGKPGQIVNRPVAPLTTQIRDLMYKHGISPFKPEQRQAKTLGDTL